MWSTSLIFATISLPMLVQACGAASPPVTCAAVSKGSRLSHVGVFEGDPANLADLNGESGVYLVGPENTSNHDGFTLKCTYSDGQIVVVPIPAAARRCVNVGPHPGNVVCR